MKAQSLDPKLAQFGLNSADRVIAREERSSNAREAQAALFRQQTERDAAKAVDDLQRQREAIQGRTQMAQLMAGLRPAPAEQPLEAIVGPDGKPRLVSRKDAIGQTPFVKASGTLDKKEQQAQDGKDSLSGIVDDLRANYDSLEKTGDITSTKNNPLANAAAFAKATFPGQLAGKIVGSSAQSERNKIMQARPALINAIKNATGMSAQQMNSNVELKLMLDSATDPTLDLEANRAALDRIERDYINGSSKPAKAKESKLSTAEQDELDQLRKRFGK
jgi:hypothetical protein